MQLTMGYFDTDYLKCHSFHQIFDQTWFFKILFGETWKYSTFQIFFSKFMMMMERWKSVPLNEHDPFKIKPAVNWFISRSTVFVTPIFAKWYWVWQPRLNVKVRKIFFQNINGWIIAPAAPYNDYVSLWRKVDSVVGFRTWETFCCIIQNCLI